MENYFIYKGIKYIIRFNNGKKELFKSINNQLTYLNESEKKEIEELLNKDYSFIYNSDRLNTIISNNQKLTNKDYFTPFVTWIESIIPEECRENFYVNMQSLNIQYNLDAITNEALFGQKEGITGYNSLENSIIMDPVAVRNLWDLYKDKENGEQLFWNEYAHNLLHELLHAASCNMDHQKMVVQMGFDKFGKEDIPEEQSNRGLTEGMTEILANAGQPDNNAYASGYFIEECLINMLLPLVGNNVMLKSFFGNKGTKDMENSLENIGFDNKKSFELFRLIEKNYQIRNLELSSNLLANIQNSLLDYLEEKLKKTEEVREIRRLIELFEQFLLTEEKLSLNGKNASLYRGIKANIARFNNIKDVYINGKDPSILSFQFDEDGNPLTNNEQVNENVNSNNGLESLRARIREEYINDIDDNVYVSTEFEINEARNQLRIVVKRKMDENTENVVISEVIPYNENMNTFLKNCASDFGECCPVMNHGILPHQNTNGYGTNNSDVVSMSGNNNLFSAKNVTQENATDIEQTLMASSHKVYDEESEKKNNKDLSLENKPKQKVYKKQDKHNGFATVGSMFMYLDLVLDIFFIIIVIMYILQHR